jgi:uncharacterized protein
MGYRDSPAQLGRDGGFRSADAGPVKAASFDSAFGEAREVADSQQERTRVGALGNATGIGSRSKSAAAWLLLLLVRSYITFLSPFFGGGCRFHPSCSNYAYEATERHGARRGFTLALQRLLRCRPFTRGGFDPVPQFGPSEVEQSCWVQDKTQPPRETSVCLSPTQGKRESAQ